LTQTKYFYMHFWIANLASQNSFLEENVFRSSLANARGIRALNKLTRSNGDYLVLDVNDELWLAGKPRFPLGDQSWGLPRTFAMPSNGCRATSVGGWNSFLNKIQLARPVTVWVRRGKWVSHAGIERELTWKVKPCRIYRWFVLSETKKQQNMRAETAAFSPSKRSNSRRKYALCSRYRFYSRFNISCGICMVREVTTGRNFRVISATSTFRE